MQDSEIEITITADGEVTVNVKNVTGPTCTELSKAYTDGLANVQSKLKGEYHQTNEFERTRAGA